ncbi:MAG: HAD family hydrolase [Bacilli bacterium]|nr:HAD family hydrolase [Bacilli bacterium]
MKQYKVYLFDFDGTLFDTLDSSTYVFKEAFLKKGVQLNEDDVLHYTRVPIPETYRKIVPSYREEDIEPFLNLITELVNSKESNKRISIYEDTYDTIIDLKMSVAILGIVTSNNEKHVKDVLKMFDMDFGLFDVIVGNETVKETKPDPTPILVALDKIKEKFSLDEVVYVGDAVNDILAAKNAGIDGVLLDRHNEYSNEKYTRINSIEELLK